MREFAEIITLDSGEQGLREDDGHEVWLEVEGSETPVPVLTHAESGEVFILREQADGVSLYLRSNVALVAARAREALDIAAHQLERLLQQMENSGAVGPWDAEPLFSADPTGEGISDQDLWDRFVAVMNRSYRRERELAERDNQLSAYLRRFGERVVAMDRRNFASQPLTSVERRNLVWMIRRMGAALPGEATISDQTFWTRPQGNGKDWRPETGPEMLVSLREEFRQKQGH